MEVAFCCNIPLGKDVELSGVWNRTFGTPARKLGVVEISTAIKLPFGATYRHKFPELGAAALDNTLRFWLNPASLCQRTESDRVNAAADKRPLFLQIQVCLEEGLRCYHLDCDRQRT